MLVFVFCLLISSSSQCVVVLRHFFLLSVDSLEIAALIRGGLGTQSALCGLSVLLPSTAAVQTVLTSEPAD